MKNIQGLKEVAIFNPANGDVVNLKLISPESTFGKEPIPTETATGAICGGYSYQVECVFFDLPAGARDQLEAWENASTPINLVGITSTGALLWYHPTTLSGFVDSLSTNARDGVSPYRVVLEAHGFLDIYYGQNIIRTAMKRNTDGKTQYDPTVNYMPLRAVSPIDDERYRLNDFGRYFDSETGDTPTPLRFAFPLDLTVTATQLGGDPFIRTRTFALAEVSASNFDDDESPHPFDTTGGYWLEVTNPADLLFSRLAVLVAGDEYTDL